MKRKELIDNLTSLATILYGGIIATFVSLYGFMAGISLTFLFISLRYAWRSRNE